MLNLSGDGAFMNQAVRHGLRRQAEQAHSAPMLQVAFSQAEPAHSSFSSVQFPSLIQTFANCFAPDTYFFTAQQGTLETFKQELAKLLGNEPMEIASVYYVDGIVCDSWSEIKPPMKNMRGDLLIADQMRLSLIHI